MMRTNLKTYSFNLRAWDKFLNKIFKNTNTTQKYCDTYYVKQKEKLL